MAAKIYTYIAIAFLLTALSATAYASTRPTANELLDKYAETQNKLKSYIIKWEHAAEESSSFERGTIHTQYKRGEIRSDGDRVRHSSLLWGTWYRQPNFRPENKADYDSMLWDGKASFQYSKDPVVTKSSYHGIAFVTKGRDQNEFNIKTIHSRMYPGHALMGYFFGSDERIDTILRQANSISVRDKTQNIAGSDCFVIDAAAKSGKYAIWIDPEHGYNIAKARVLRKKGDLMYTDVMGREDRISVSLKNVRFEKIDGVWVPMEADTIMNRRMIRGDWTKSNDHHKRTEITLNPDHNKLNAFVPDDIENGATVHIIGIQGIQGTWKDGTIIDRDGNKVDMEKIRNKTKNIKN